MNAFKVFLKAVTTPLGIALAMMQWIVILFAYLGDNPEPGFGNSTYLLQYLVFLNFPALIITNLIAKTIIVILNISLWKNSVYTFVSIFFITLQWILVGKIIELFVESIKETPVKILK